MNTRYTTVNLDVSQQGSIPSITLSQYDLGVGLGFYIMDGGVPYSEFAETDTVVLSGTKPSGIGFTVPAYYKSGNLCSFRTPQAMTTEAGTVTCEITITKVNNISVSTANFFVEVEASAHAHETVDEDIEDFSLIANQVGEYKAVAVRAAQQAAQSATDAAASAGSAEESMEAAQSAASSAIAAKDDIQEYIDDSEAWARGTRGGTAVPSTDETYENNAKYYAEQSSQASMDAGSSATEAAASAQEAAASVVGAVKYTVQSLTDEQKIQARINIGAIGSSDIPSGVVRYDTAQSLTDAQKTQAKNNIEVPAIDATLAVTGAAADAKKVGDELTDLKGDLNELDDMLDIAEIVDSALSSSDLENGAVNGDGLNTGTLNYRVRTIDYIPVPENSAIQVDVVSGKDVYFIPWYYDTNDFTTPKIGSGTWVKGGKLTCPPGTKYIRLVFSINKSTDPISPSDITSITVKHYEITSLGNVVKTTPQTLTDEQKIQAQENIGIRVSDSVNVSFGSSDFVYGSFDATTGKNTVREEPWIRICSKEFIEIPDGAYSLSAEISSDKYIRFSTYVFDTNDGTSQANGGQLHYGWQQSINVQIPEGRKYLKFNMMLNAGSDTILPSDVDSLEITYRLYDSSGYVKFTSQILTEPQKEQARENIGVNDAIASANSKKLYIGDMQLGHPIGNLIDTTDSYATKRICMKDLVVFPTKRKKIKIRFNEKYHINALFGSTAYDIDGENCPSLYNINNNSYVTVSGTEIEIPERLNYYRFVVVLGSDHNYEFSEVPNDINLEVEYEDETNVSLTNAPSTNLIVSAKAIRRPRGSSILFDYVPTLFVIGHASDTHGDFKRAKNFFDYCEYINADMSCVTGDIIATNTQSGANWFLDIVNNLKRTVPAICIGNHEVWPSNRASFTDADVYNEYYAPIANKLQNTTGKSWYSVTFEDKLIKVISLNQYQESGITDRNRGFVHFKEDQINWFINELNNTPENYGIILLYHQPEGTVPPIASDYPEFYCTDDGYRSDTHVYGSLEGTPIVDIIDAFIGRTTLSKTYSQDGTPSSFGVSADFSNVASGVEFIAHLYGHLHTDKISYYPNTQYKQLACLITLTNAVYGTPVTGGYAESSDVIREMGTSSQDAFNVYVIDRENKLFKVVRVGNTKTYGMKDRDYMEIPYADSN